MLTLHMQLQRLGGGATRFPDLAYNESSFAVPMANGPSLEVYAKKGTALIWPSVLSHDPSLQDDRTFHEAMPVTKGVKYGANQWLHLRAYEGYD